MMKKIFLILIALGLLVVLIFWLVDTDGRIGAAQLLGMELGLALALIGFGLMRMKTLPNNLAVRARAALSSVLASPPTVWAVATFLALYLALFLSPLLFSHPTIHYFEKYIPDAWVTRIGFDLEQTVSHIQVWLTEGTSPYEDGIVPYSPLTLILFAPLVILGYPAYFKFLSIVTFLAFILGALLIPMWINHNVERDTVSPNRGGNILLLLFFLTGLFSYGFQFELERGQFNVIAFACALSAIYLFRYHKSLHIFAYLLFSLAVQLKLYPAIFIVMFIEDWRDWKGNLKRLTGLGLFNLALLFILGFDLGSQYVVKLIARQSGFVSSRTEDLSISGFVYHLTTDGFGLLVPETMARLAQFSGLLSFLFLALFLGCLLAVLIQGYRTRQNGLNLSLLVIATLCGLVIPAASFDYKLPILAAPLALFLSNLPNLSTASKRLASFTLTLTLCLAYWSTQAPFTVKPTLFAGNFPALLIILLTATGLHFLTAGEAKRE